MASRYILGAVFLVMLGTLGLALLDRQTSVVAQNPYTQAAEGALNQIANPQSQTQTQTPTQAPPASTGGASGSTSSGITLAQVARHGGASSCWSAINGKVYDLTSWINQHPGGPGFILDICGTDASAAFNAQHGGQRRPEQELAGFYIGTLAS